MFIRTMVEGKTQPCITFLETRNGAVSSFMCAKRREYEDLAREILRHFLLYGFLKSVILQCEKEAGIIDVCRRRKCENFAGICA